MSEARRLTRDLLLDYSEYFMPPVPRTAGLNTVYPWANATLSLLANQLYQIAANSGYTGTSETFYEQFGAYLENKTVYFSIFSSFPEEGEMDKLYFDTEDKILYYWDNEYAPVSATLIEDTIIYNEGAPYDE